MYFFTTFGSVSFETTYRSKNSYTYCRCGHDASRTGSSSSGSYCMLCGVFVGASPRKRFAEIIAVTSGKVCSLKTPFVLLM